MVTRKRKRTKSKTRQAEVLRDVEAETLKLLERHGVRLSDAQRNFEAENTQIVPASELARLPFVLSDETRKYLSQHAPADSDTKEPSLGTKTQRLIDRTPTVIAELASTEQVEGGVVAWTETTEIEERPSSHGIPTNVTILQNLRVPSVRPSEDCVEVLLSHDGLRIGQQFYLRENALQFGRGSRCPVRFESIDVSRNHCVLERKGRELILVDTNSTNGVLVNGRRVRTSIRLKHGDKIQINKTVFALLTPLETIKVFVSYGTPDARFSQSLTDALREHGFDVFFFQDSAQDYIGERIFSVTRGQITERDVVLLVCSKESLERKGVHAELNHVLAKEERCGGTGFLVPLALDDSFLHWAPQDAVLGDAIRERIVADFRNLEDEQCLNEAFSKLATRIRKIGQRV